MEELRKKRIWEYTQRWPEKKRQLTLTTLWLFSFVGMFYAILIVQLSPVAGLVLGFPLLMLLTVSWLLNRGIERRLRRAWKAHKAEPIFPVP